MEKTRTYATHPAAFVNQPVAAPHQAFLPIGSEVPLVKKSSFPPGEAKNSENHQILPFIEPLRCVSFGRLRASPTGRVPIFERSKILKHPLSQPVRADSSPRGGAKSTSCQRRHCRLCFVAADLSVTGNGGGSLLQIHTADNGVLSEFPLDFQHCPLAAFFPLQIRILFFTLLGIPK